MTHAELGVVAEVARYPVKSMAGESLSRAFVTTSGLCSDRVWAFVREGGRPEFPWLTAREIPRLVSYTPRFRMEPEVRHHPNQEAYAVEVTTPHGAVLPIDSEELRAELEQLHGGGVTLRFSEMGQQDAMPLSMIGLESAQSVARMVGDTGPEEVFRRRFRANLYARWHEPMPFFEDDLVGKRLRIGETLEIFVAKKDARCVIVNCDPLTAEVETKVLRTIARAREGRLGVYCVVTKEGFLERGAPIIALG